MKEIIIQIFYQLNEYQNKIIQEKKLELFKNKLSELSLNNIKIFHTKNCFPTNYIVKN